MSVRYDTYGSDNCCAVRLRNGETMIALRDGWNPGEELPVVDVQSGFVWVIRTSEIVGYRSLIEAERMWVQQSVHSSLLKAVQVDGLNVTRPPVGR